MNTAERWVDVEEAAAHLGVNKDSIYRWIETRGFPAHRAGRLFRFKLSEIDEWVMKSAGDDSKQGSLVKASQRQARTASRKSGIKKGGA